MATNHPPGKTEPGERVKKLYALGSARWYDFFKGIWNRLVAGPAERELEIFLRDNLNPGTNILELGCGTALNLEKILARELPFKKYLGLDFSPEMLGLARAKFALHPNVEFRQQDLQALDDIPEKFDIILGTWVLSHLPAPADLVNRAQQWLAPGGKLFLIFFSTPRWYVRIWLSSLAKYLFRAKYVSESEISQFKNVKERRSYSANIATVAVISS